MRLPAITTVAADEAVCAGAIGIPTRNISRGIDCRGRRRDRVRYVKGSDIAGLISHEAVGHQVGIRIGADDVSTGVDCGWLGAHCPWNFERDDHTVSLPQESVHKAVDISVPAHDRTGRIRCDWPAEL